MAAAPSSITFKVADVELKRYSNKNKKSIKSTICSQLKRFLNKNKKSTICSQLEPYDKNHCTEVLVETQFPSSVRASRNNGFVNTVIECYNNHYNLVIRPDDIWTAIMTQFSFYINANAEEFRGQFVNFEGKKELEVTLNGRLRSAPCDLFVTLMTEKIHENLVDDTVKDWVLPSFTTTTPNDIISCGIVLMATTKKYFDYSWCLCCGIPFITLEGSVDDWENILKRLEKLKDYKLDKWYDMLKSILMEFAAARKNQPNIDFWNRICHKSGGGSGPTFISGWLTAFAAFDEEGKWIDKNCMAPDCGGKIWPKIDISGIPPGIVAVDVKIIDWDEVEYKSVMFAGHIAYEVLEDDYTLKPRIGWGMALKLTDEEIKKVHEVARGRKASCCEICEAPLDE